jgi:hypothetical protein
VTTFDEDADDAMAIANEAAANRDRAAMAAELTVELRPYIIAAGLTPGQPSEPMKEILQATPVDVIAQALIDAHWYGAAPLRDIAGALLTDVEETFAAAGRDELPLTCASPEAHAREARRRKPLWWLREAGLLDGKPADDQPCPVCRLPRPKSHRRNV